MLQGREDREVSLVAVVHLDVFRQTRSIKKPQTQRIAEKTRSSGYLTSTFRISMRKAGKKEREQNDSRTMVVRLGKKSCALSIVTRPKATQRPISMQGLVVTRESAPVHFT